MPLPEYDQDVAPLSDPLPDPLSTCKLPEPVMVSSLTALSPVCRLPLSLTVPLPLTAPVTVKVPEPLYEASLLTVVVIEALPGSLQVLPLALSVQLPPMTPVSLPEAYAVPLAFSLYHPYRPLHRPARSPRRTPCRWHSLP